jgi:hypothetical protein
MWFSEHDGEKAAGTPEVVAIRTESGLVPKERTNNDAAARQFLCKIDLVARRALDQVHVRQLVTNLDKGRSRGVEEAAASNSARAGQQAGGREHRECWASGGFECRRIRSGRSDGGGWQTSELAQAGFCRLAGGSGDRRLPSSVAGCQSSRVRGRGHPRQASVFFCAHVYVCNLEGCVTGCTATPQIA